MKSKLLFTAALMSAASLASQETYEAKGIVTDKSAYEYAMGRLLADAEDGQVDVSGWVMRNAKMSILSAGRYDGQMGWKTDVTGGNFRIYAIPNDPNNKDVILGDCPCPNGVERWQGNDYHYEANTKIIYQDTKLPQGKYTVVMWAECQNLGDHTLKDGKSEARLQLFFDNFRLTLVNDGAQEIQGLYDAELAEAQAIDEAYLPEKLQAALKQAIEMPVATLDERYAAYNALKQAVEECTSVVGISKDIAGLLEECSIYKENSTADQETVNAFEIAIKTAEGYVQLETVEEFQTCYEALENARRTFVQSATPMGEHQFDMTFMVKNPDVTGMPKAYVSDFGWVSCTGSTSNNFNNNNDPSQFYESYQGTEFTPSTWVLYQEVNVPAGQYEITLRAFGNRANIGGEGQLKAAVYAGEKQGDWVENGKTLDKVYNVSFFQATESVLKLGVKTEEGNLANWIGCNDMKLYKVAPKAEALALDETGAYDVKADMYADVTLQRKLVAEKWNTFCVPFALTAEQVEANKLGEVRRLSGMQASGEGITLDFDKVDAVEAGVPYLVKPEEAVTEIKADGVMVSAKQPEAFPMNLVSMTGNYDATTVPQGAYFIKDDMFYLADQTDKVSLKGFRAYINVDSESPVAGVNRLLIDIDGAVTSVGEVLDNTAEDGGKMVDVFTLSGVKVKAGVKKAEALSGLECGIYIIGGKKVIK